MAPPQAAVQAVKVGVLVRRRQIVQMLRFGRWLSRQRLLWWRFVLVVMGLRRGGSLSLGRAVLHLRRFFLLLLLLLLLVLLLLL